MAYTTTTKQWFNDAAPALVDAAGDDVAGAIAGPVLFEIAGADGGAWLVDFALRTVRSVDASKPGAVPKLIVRAAERDFMALVEGRMSADDGVLTKRLHVAGDVSSIARLMTALTDH